MITISTGQTKKFPTDLSNIISVPISDLTGIRVVLGENNSSTARVKEWRYPTETGYGNVVIVNDVDRQIEFALLPEDTLDYLEEVVLDLEIGIKDDDALYTDYIDISVAKKAFKLVPAKVYN